MGGGEDLRTDIRQVGRVLGSDVTETLSSLVEQSGGLWIIGVEVLNLGGERDKLLCKITK